MTEQYPEGWGQAPAEPLAPAVPTDAPATAPREFTPDELAEARRQLVAQGADLGPGPEVAESGAALGMQAMAAGAQASEVDADAMLAAIRSLQAQVAALEREKKLAQAPEVVKYAQALFDHLAVKAAQHPTVQADPDHTYGKAPNAEGHGGQGLLGAAGAIVTAAEAAADTGQPGTLAADVGKVETWVKRHARRFPHIDYSYILDLAEETAGAVLKLAA